MFSTLEQQIESVDIPPLEEGTQIQVHVVIVDQVEVGELEHSE